MAEKRIVDIGPLLEDLKNELEDLKGATEVLTVEEAAEDEIEELKKLLVIDPQKMIPACRMCNHYKRANSLEVFRRYIAEIPRKLRGDYIYKIGVAYGNVVENEKPIEFFFETEEAKTSPGAAIMSPEDMAHYLMDLCHCRLAAGKGCPGCPFDKPTSNNGDGECRLYVPDDWDF